MEEGLNTGDFVSYHYIHIHRETGEVVGMSAGTVESKSEIPDIEFISVTAEEYATMRYRRCYFDGVIFVDIPPSPSVYYDWNTTTKAWEKNAARIAEFMPDDIRAGRDRLLAESDWTDTASAPVRLGQEKWQAWQDYRQALRDVTSQPDFPEDVVWPTAPA